ncbi:MAG: glycosyltransferase family 2 protein [Cyanobacteria bacterium P01_H01_bin.15]
MSDYSQADSQFNDEFEAIGSFFEQWDDPEEAEAEFREDFFQGLGGRRRKAALVLSSVWLTIICIYSISWGIYLVWGLTVVLGLQALRLFTASPAPQPAPLNCSQSATLPTVSLMVAAKNEEAVVSRLVHQLCELDYPSDRYEVWVIDDCSSDHTPHILQALSTQFPQLQVVRRKAGATGGKSGALNQVLPLTQGEYIGVFDADALVPKDLLRCVLPLFLRDEVVGAVQVRKAISNQNENFWTRGQWAEMALDTCLQRQRIASGGMGELRGNGQFVSRQALQSCGRWNEETITDDLDLTIRLHLDGWKIDFLSHPAVGEEGVTRLKALWHQRNRWAEGGFQRYLDYWRLIGSRRLNWQKKADLLYFAFLQYTLPTAAIPDLLLSLYRHRFSMLSPLSGLIVLLSLYSMSNGLRLITSWESNSKKSFLKLPWQIFQGMVYLLHWLVVMMGTTARMSIRPKRLKWVKTVHAGVESQTLA